MLRAQLIEQGFEVLATDAWSTVRRWLRAVPKPKAVVVDLQDLDRPSDILEDLRILMKPRHVVVITAAATVAAPDIEKLGFHLVKRPATIHDVVAAVAAATGRSAETKTVPR